MYVINDLLIVCLLVLYVQEQNGHIFCLGSIHLEHYLWTLGKPTAIQ